MHAVQLTLQSRVPVQSRIMQTVRAERKRRIQHRGGGTRSFRFLGNPKETPMRFFPEEKLRFITARNPDCEEDFG